MLQTVIKIIKTRYRAFVIIFVVGVIAGLLLTRTHTLQYVASMIVTPARYSSDTKPSGVSSSSLGGVASLLSGGSEGSDEISDFNLYLELLTSPRVAQALFDHEPDLVHRIYGNQWDGEHWQQPHGFTVDLKSGIYRMLGAPGWEPPDALMLSDNLKGAIILAKSARAAVVTISYQSPDRNFAIQLLTVLHRETERIMRDDARAASLEKAQYLSQIITNTPGMAVSDVMIQAEIRNQISAALSQSPVAFAAEFIAPPSAPFLPNRRILLTFPLLCGVLAVLATFGAFLFAAWRRQNYALPATLAWIRG